jgi:hypothetical protein
MPGTCRAPTWLHSQVGASCSNNSALEDKLFNKRAHSVGHEGQKANLLGYALLVNSLTLYLAKRRGGVRGELPILGAVAA